MIAPTGVSLMPIDPQVVFQFLGDPPDPGSTDVRVSGEFRRGFGWFKGPSIPMDYRSYIFYGHTILARGIKVATKFEIDTRSPTLLAGLGTWHLGGIWYSPFEPEALALLGVLPENARPFSWTSNVPIETIEEPPYHEGQILHCRNPPGPYKPDPSLGKFSARTPGKSPPRPAFGEGSLPVFELEPDEFLRWSCRAWSTRSAHAGNLVLTSRRVFFETAPLDPLASAKPFEVGLREAIDVGCVRMQTLPSGARERLALRLILVGDREEVFEVDDVMQAIERFGKEITPIEL
jgi:hypothetical protein